jgi:hypothetical protein
MVCYRFVHRFSLGRAKNDAQVMLIQFGDRPLSPPIRMNKNATTSAERKPALQPPGPKKAWS